MGIDARRLGDPGGEDFRLDRYPFYLLNRAVGRYAMVIAPALRLVGLDVPTWRVLMVLGNRGPRGMSALADAAVIKLPTVQRITQRMALAGLVATRCSPTDGRVTELEITAAGMAALAAARPITSAVYARLINGVTEAEFVSFIETLGKLQANLDQMENVSPIRASQKRIT